uniref:Uncharacterized protein n=1 Tax=Heterorhabditis bacteriophora TaxID=37862 RepID=A0A1I7WWR2_HETBA
MSSNIHGCFLRPLMFTLKKLPTVLTIVRWVNGENFLICKKQLCRKCLKPYANAEPIVPYITRCEKCKEGYHSSLLPMNTTMETEVQELYTQTSILKVVLYRYFLPHFQVIQFIFHQLSLLFTSNDNTRAKLFDRFCERIFPPLQMVADKLLGCLEINHHFTKGLFPIFVWARQCFDSRYFWILLMRSCHCLIPLYTLIAFTIIDSSALTGLEREVE